jgi:hypothetical protein
MQRKQRKRETHFCSSSFTGNRERETWTFSPYKRNFLTLSFLCSTLMSIEKRKKWRVVKKAWPRSRTRLILTFAEPEVSRVAQDLVGLMGPASTTKTQPKTQLKLKLIWARRRIIGGQDKGRSSVQEDEEEDIPNTLKRRQTRNVCVRHIWVKNDYVSAKRFWNNLNHSLIYSAVALKPDPEGII